MGRRFTPLQPDGSRAAMILSESDWKLIRRGRHWFAVVTDLATGLHYEVEGTECSLPRCFCGARVLRQVDVRHPVEDERRQLEADLAAISGEIEELREYSKSLALRPVYRHVNGQEEDITELALAANEQLIADMKEEARSIERKLCTKRDTTL